MNSPSFPLSRRHLLQAVGVTGSVAVAGCLTKIPQGTSCENRTRLSLTEVQDSHVSNEFSTPVDGLPYGSKAIVNKAIETGEATSRGYYSPQPHDEYVVTSPNPHFYRVRATTHDPVVTTGYEYSVDVDVNEAPLSDNDQVYSFTELPSHDRDSIHRAIGNSHLLHAPHYSSFTVVFAYELLSIREQSVFVPEATVTYVRWDGILLRLTPTESRPVQIKSTTLTAERVAESPEKFLTHMGSTRGVVLSELTGDQREIIDQAIEDEYTECQPRSDGFSGLIEQLSTGEGKSVPLVRYDGVWYFTHLSW